VTGTATFTGPQDCYRLSLTRDLSPGGGWRKTLGSVMLNPSTADGSKDDPTIRRCLGFARAWGFHQLVVRNLIPYRATSPDDLWQWLAAVDQPELDDILGRNRLLLGSLTARADYVVVAWGSTCPSGKHPARLRYDLARYAAEHRLMANAHPGRLICLGTTRDGFPRHPLYVGKRVRAVTWSEPGMGGGR